MKGPCVFPFRLKGKMYDDCVVVKENSGTWCAVRVDEYLELSVWGSCRQKLCEKPKRNYKLEFVQEFETF